MSDARQEGSEIIEVENPKALSPQAMFARRQKCEGCSLERQPEDFAKFDAEPRIEGDPRLCDYCFTYGPPVRDPLAKMDVKTRQAMQHLAGGGTIADAARIRGCDPTTIKHQLSGRDRGVFREAFQALLIDGGIGPDRIVKTLEGSLEADRYFMGKSGEIESAPDHSTRLKAANLVVKLLDLQPPQELSKMTGAGTTAIALVINTNIDATVVEQEPEAFTVEASHVD